MRLTLLALLACACAPSAQREQCYEGRRAGDVAAELRGTFAVEAHPVLAGRFSVRAPGIIGKLEDGAPGCAGARLSLWPVAEGGTSNRAGPVGPRATRVPAAP